MKVLAWLYTQARRAAVGALILGFLAWVVYELPLRSLQ